MAVTANSRFKSQRDDDDGKHKVAATAILWFKSQLRAFTVNSGAEFRLLVERPRDKNCYLIFFNLVEGLK